MFYTFDVARWIKLLRKILIIYRFQTKSFLGCDMVSYKKNLVTNTHKSRQLLIRGITLT